MGPLLKMQSPWLGVRSRGNIKMLSSGEPISGLSSNASLLLTPNPHPTASSHYSGVGSFPALPFSVRETWEVPRDCWDARRYTKSPSTKDTFTEGPRGLIHFSKAIMRTTGSQNSPTKVLMPRAERRKGVCGWGCGFKINNR